MWRLLLNRLQLRGNLIDKGVDVHNSLCPFCVGEPKNVEDLFLRCEIAARTWDGICRWVDLKRPLTLSIIEWFNCRWVDLKRPLTLSIIEWFNWLELFPCNSKRKEIVQSIMDITF